MLPSSLALCISLPWEAVSHHLLGLWLHPCMCSGPSSRWQGTSEAGAGWANGNVSVPIGLGNCS